MLQELSFMAGVYVDDSALVARGKYVAANNIRFVRGIPQARYGNEKFSQTQLSGIARGLHAWADRSFLRYLAVGTHTNLYASDQDGIDVLDITPVISYGTLVNALTTDGTTATITVAQANHGLVSGQYISFPYIAATVNGATITPTTKYSVNVMGTGTYTFNADTVSTSAGTSTFTIEYRYYLAAGNQDGIGGGGFGTGSYGLSGYDTVGSGLTLYPRTWSFANWGNNVIANPRGDAIFEWAPNFTNSETVTNSNFSASTGWTVGAGWSVGGLNANASATSSSLTQNITLPVASWNLLHLVATATSGAWQVSYGATTIQTGTSTGCYQIPFFSGAGGSQTLAITGATFSGNITIASVQTQLTATQVTSAPNPCTCVFSTSERILVACGVPDDSGNFDPMLVRWSDQENNQVWTATPSNLAGDYPLTNGSRIVRGLPGNRENLIWTDKALYAMRYVPDPNVVYDMVEIGPGAGLIGPNAACIVNGIAYWKAPNGQDYYYNGGPPTPITSNTMRRDFNDNLAWVQQDKIFSSSISAWNEVQHLYPDSRDGSEVSRYNKYNFADDVWDPGLANLGGIPTNISCWLDQGVFQYPIAVDLNGFIRYCEKDNSVDGGLLSGYVTSAKFRQGDGDKHMTINGMAADAAGLIGSYSVTLTTFKEDIRGATSKAFGPYSFNGMSGRVAMRGKGETAELMWSWNGSQSFWRQGAVRLDMQNGGDRR